MNTGRKRIALATAALVLTTFGLSQAAPTLATSETTTRSGFDLAAFANPPSDSRPAVLWFWNGTVTTDLVDRQLADLRDRGVEEAILFPFDTPNLRPAFFSEDWFAIVGHTLREAQRTGMKLWLFNDDFFPSGRGGGLVVNGGTVGDRTYLPHPELRPKGLTVQRRTVTGPTDVKLVQPSTGLTVDGGRLVVDGPVLDGAAVLRAGHDWTDYTLTARTRIESGSAGLVVRSPDARNGYLVDTGPDGAVSVWRQIDGVFALLRGGTPVAGFDPSAEHEISVVARGNTITPVLDGTALPAVTDDRFPTGTAGVRAVSSQRSTHDSLAVRDPSGAVLYTQGFDDDSALDDFVPKEASGQVVAAAARPEGSTDATKVVDLTSNVASGVWKAPAGRWTVETFTATPLADDNPSSFRRFYLDLLDDEAVDRFLDAVPGEYYRRFPWAFGTVLKGFWDDEPFIVSAEAHFRQPPWTPSLPAQLSRRGTTPGKALSATFADLGRAGRTARGSYWRAVSDRFADGYYKRQARWMADHSVGFIGNALDDIFGPGKDLVSTGNLLADNAWAQVPGTDVVFPGTYTLGGRTEIPRSPASVAHQNGAPRVLLESFGAMGWDVDPEFVRGLLGPFAARGINLTVLHAMWTDPGNVVYPPPFQQENPWWHAAKPMTDWIGRVMQAGRGMPVAQTALIQPQRAVEQWQGTATQTALDADFTAAEYALEDEQVDFDLLDEGALTGDPTVRRHAAVRGGTLRAGPQRYRLAVLPQTPTIDLETVRTLDRLARSGGTVVAVGTLPAEEAGGDDAGLRTALGRLFGAGEDSVVRRGAGTAVRISGPAGLGVAAHRAGTAAVSLSPPAPGVRVLRMNDDADLTFLVSNESGRAVQTWATFAASGTPDLLDPRTGTAELPVFDTDATGRTAMALNLAPYETRVVTFRRAQRPPSEVPHLVSGDLEVRGLAVRDGQLQGEALATGPGPVRLVGRSGARVYAGTVTAADPLTPIRLDGPWATRLERPGETEKDLPLGSWSTTDPGFSGSATYRKSVHLEPADLAGRRLTLDLGGVGSVAEVSVNGRGLDPVLWQPYTVDVTDALRAGDNDIVVRVSNTPANAHGMPKASGLLGPVRLVPRRWVPLALDEVGAGGEIVVRQPGTAALAPGQTVELAVPVRRYAGQGGTVGTAATAEGLGVSASPGQLYLGRNGSAVVTVRITAPPEADPAVDHSLTITIGGKSVTTTVSVRPATRLGTATASSSYTGHPITSINDGVTSSDAWESGQGWNDGTFDAFPDTAGVTFTTPAQVGGLDVYTLDSAVYPAASYGIRDADAQLRVAGQWRTVATLRSNTSGVWHPRFTPVVADAARIVISASNDQHYSRLIEIESLAR